FLDEVCTTTWEVADGRVHAYDGGYAAYTLARAERARVAAVTEERRLNLVRKELAWLRRGPPARTSKPRFRIEAAQALIADVAPAYLSQHVTELPGRLRVLEAVQEIARIARIGNQEISASSLAERFGFPASRQWTPVGDLSGGERRRLQLLRLLMAEPNVLLLDEPTNDLDIDTLTALEDLLDSFAGTVLVVSHDRYFVDRVCDTVVALMGDGTLAALPGGVEEYLARRAAGEAQLSGVPAPPAASPAAPAAPGLSAAEVRTARKEAA